MNHIIQRPGAISTIAERQLDFILLDGSSSMKSKWWPMLGAIDQYIATLKTENVDSHCILHVFDTADLQVEHRNTPISGWRDFAEAPIGSYFGGTPLYDAIVIMGAKIRDLNPQHGATILIVTDGDETSSKCSLAQARGVLDWLRAQNYNVIFFGCDFDNQRQARALGCTPSNSIGVRKEKLKEATKLLAAKRVQNSRSGQDINFSDDEKTKFGGYLGHST